MSSAPEYNPNWDNYYEDSNIKMLASRFKEKLAQYKKWEGCRTTTIFYDGKSTNVQVAMLNLKDELIKTAVDINDRIQHIDHKKLNGKPVKQNSSYGNIEVFVSHASKDKTIVDLFVKHILILGLGIQEDQIFYTSMKGMDIKTGDDFREAIRDGLKAAKLSILVITSNYKTSEVCLNEMGAAWASPEMKVIPLILEPINFQSVGVVMQPKQVGKLDDRNQLNKLHDEISTHLSLTKKGTAIWSGHVETFLSQLKLTLEKHDFTTPVTNDEFNKLKTELEIARKTITDITRDYTQLEEKFKMVANLKDRQELDTVEEKFVDYSDLENLKTLDKAVKTALNNFSNVVGSILLCDYFERPYKPDYQNYSGELNEAERKKILTFDSEGASPNTSNPFVKQLHSALKQLGKHIEKIEKNSVDDSEQFEAIQKKHFEQYKCDLDHTYQDYWSNHFNFTLAYEK